MYHIIGKLIHLMLTFSRISYLFSIAENTSFVDSKKIHQLTSNARNFGTERAKSKNIFEAKIIIYQIIIYISFHIINTNNHKKNILVEWWYFLCQYKYTFFVKGINCGVKKLK